MDPRSSFHEGRVARPLLRWMVPVAVILLAVAASGDTVGSGPTASTGAQVTKSVPFVRESIAEIRALAPLRTREAPGDRAIPFRRIPWPSGATGNAAAPSAGAPLAVPFPGSSPSRSAPALDSSFAGLGNPPRSQGDVIPPDTMGAVGPNHLVSLLNSDFGVFDKTTGAPIPNQQVSLQSFWGSLGTARGRPGGFSVRHENSLRPAQRAVCRHHPRGKERPGFLGHDRRLLHVRPHGRMGQMGDRRGPRQQRPNK